MKLANDMYQIFIENFPNSLELDKARARLIYTRLATYRGPAFNDAGLDDARKELFLSGSKQESDEMPESTPGGPGVFFGRGV
jgi:hypothetical protein